MTSSPNHSRKFPWYEPFSRSRKLDFPNKYNSDLLSNVFDVFNFSCYFSQCRRSLPPTLTHFPALFFLFLWILFITKYDKIILYEYKHTQKEVFSKRPKLESNTREDGDNKGGFLLTCMHTYFDFIHGLRYKAFQTLAKHVSRSVWSPP